MFPGFKNNYDIFPYSSNYPNKREIKTVETVLNKKFLFQLTHGLIRGLTKKLNTRNRFNGLLHSEVTQATL